MKRIVIFVLIMFFLSLVVSGWIGDNMASLCGKVVMPDGSAIPGVEVILTGEGNVTKRTFTSEEGNFRFLDLYPGIYWLEFKLEGFKSVIYKDILLVAGKRENIEVQMEASTIREEIVITGKTGAVDVRKTTAGARNPWKVLNQTPGTMNSREDVGGNKSKQQSAFYGLDADSKKGKWNVDGADISDPAAIGAAPSYLNYSHYQSPPSCQQQFNTEEYDRIYENRFLETTENPLSTFSIDVDTASYANVRRYIKGSTLPPKDAVRIEEMINYFSYDYPQPAAEAPFSIVTEISSCPWNLSHKLVHIGLQGRKMRAEKRPPSNLVFLLDVSGSMCPANKLPLLKSAFKLLVEKLDDKDRVAIVVYAGAAGLVLDSTPGFEKSKINGALDKLHAGGCTAGGAGIRLAYKIALENFIKEGNNRVILATDGDFNIGVSSTSELVRMIEEKREKGVFLTVLGFGMGNYKDSRMENLADKGNGNYFYIDNLLEAKKVFIEEMSATLFTIAKDVKIQVEFNPAKVKAYKLIGYENRMLKKEDFNDDKKDAGELGAGHTVTALYEIIPAGSLEEVSSVDELKYQEMKIKRGTVKSSEIMTVKLRYKEPDGKKSKLIVKAVPDKKVKLHKASENFRFSAAVAQFGLLLRDSQFKEKASYESVLELAKKAKGKDTHGYRAEFIKLVEVSKLMNEALAEK